MPFRPDSEIEHDVLHELRWDAAVDARNLGVTAAEGVVTITGEVSAYAEKREAERLAEMIPGVREVIVNIVVVAAEILDDEELGVAANNALRWAAYLPVGAASARVERGWITLTGTVH